METLITCLMIISCLSASFCLFDLIMERSLYTGEYRSFLSKSENWPLYAREILLSSRKNYVRDNTGIGRFSFAITFLVLAILAVCLMSLSQISEDARVEAVTSSLAFMFCFLVQMSLHSLKKVFYRWRYDSMALLQHHLKDTATA